jgi:hypothetical protein
VKVFKETVLFFSLCSGAYLYGDSSLPRDLNDLSNRWEMTKKTPSAQDFINMEVLEIDSIDGKYARAIIQRELDLSAKEGDLELSKLRFEMFDEEVRSKLLKNIYKKGIDKLLFCKAFVLPEFNIKDRDSLTDSQINSLERRHKTTSCKNDVANLFGGIMHANPSVYVVERHRKLDSEREVVVYVQSFVDTNKYIRYSFMTL